MPSKHAEIDVLNKIKTRKKMPKKIDLFVIRLTKTGMLAESRPCFHCIQEMEKSCLNIRYIYYSTKDGKIAKEKLSHMMNSPLTYISSGVRKRNKRQY